jgi:dolichol-phosphate mannosyltransferase
VNLNRVALVMPVYNEADGITEFLHEIDASFSDLHVIFVDDCSTDKTVKRIDEFEPRNVVVSVMSNDKNLGHGPSTLRALSEGIKCGAKVVIASDGDGQISGVDLRQLLAEFEAGNCQMMVGIRVERDDASFRVFTSWVTRVITGSRARSEIRDANSPFRVYETESLEKMLSVIPSMSMVPNLWMTVIAHRFGFDICSCSIRARDRRGSTARGSTWGRGFSSFPSRRFIKFCFQAIIEWIREWPKMQRSLGGEL